MQYALWFQLFKQFESLWVTFLNLREFSISLTNQIQYFSIRKPSFFNLTSSGLERWTSILRCEFELKFLAGSDEVKFMRYLCYSILARCIIIRFCRAWRDVDLPSESGNRVVVSAKRETRAECSSSSHVSTGRTLVLTIRPWGPMFVFTAVRYCSAAV